jgi:hypothetical protein
LVLVLLLFLLAPLVAFAAGFVAGQIRQRALRLIVAAAIILFPLAFFLVPLLHPSASPDSRYAAGFGLAMFGFHIGLWTLFGTLGVFVGAAKARAPG